MRTTVNDKPVRRWSTEVPGTPATHCLRGACPSQELIRLCRTHRQLSKCLPRLLQLCKQSRETGSEYLLPLPGQPGVGGETSPQPLPGWLCTYLAGPAPSQRRRRSLPQAPCLPVPGEHGDYERPLPGDTTSHLSVLEQTWKGRCFQ